MYSIHRNPRMEVLFEYFSKEFIATEVSIDLPFGFAMNNMNPLGSNKHAYIHTCIHACMHTNFHVCIIHTFVSYVVCMCSYVSR